MRSSYIDIHTHSPKNQNNELLEIANVVIGEEKIPHHNIWHTLGLHPYYLHDHLLTQLIEKSSSPYCLAIGECGLDKRSLYDFELQKNIFIKQIKLAASLHKPLIIHCVRSYNEILQILKENKVIVPVVFHGFNRKKELALDLIRRGYYLSLGAQILGGKQDELIKNVDLDYLFLETDESNTDIEDIYTYFSDVRGVALSELKSIITVNFDRVFGKIRQVV